MTLKLKIIIGSTRPGRGGPTVAAWVAKAAEAQGDFAVETVDMAEVALPLLDEPQHPAMQQYVHDHTKAWSAIAADADAFIFVTPEYNFFPPAVLVNAVQTLSREWKYKPAGVVCYGGISGGLRSAQELRLLLGNQQMVALPQVVPAPFYANFIEDGVFTPNDKMEEGMGLLLAELVKWGEALKPLHSA